jgi:hypothetical protein
VRRGSGRERLVVALAAALIAISPSRPSRAERSSGDILAIDIGGLGVKYQLFAGDGRPLSRATRVATPPRATPQQIESLVIGIHRRVTRRMAPGRRLEGVVIGFPGTVERGRVRGAPNLDAAAWHNRGRGVNLEGRLRRRLPVRVVVDSDLIVASHGLAPATGRTLLVGLGTGVGVTVIERARTRLRIGSPWQDHATEMTELERTTGEHARRAVGTERWNLHVVDDVIPTLRDWTTPDRVLVFGGNAEHLRRDPALRRKLRRSGIELHDNPRFANLKGAVPYWKATARGRRRPVARSSRLRPVPRARR